MRTRSDGVRLVGVNQSSRSAFARSSLAKLAVGEVREWSTLGRWTQTLCAGSRSQVRGNPTQSRSGIHREALQHFGL